MFSVWVDKYVLLDCWEPESLTAWEVCHLQSPTLALLFTAAHLVNAEFQLFKYSYYDTQILDYVQNIG